MSGFGGLFTRQSAREISKKSIRRRNKNVSVGTLKKMGLAGVQHMNPQALNPGMGPHGSKKPEVLVLGEFPTADDDKQGKAFSGKAGGRMERAIPKWIRNKVRYDLCVRTLPPLDRKGKRRKPKREEIECFRETIEKSILASRPKVVIASGAQAMSWFYPKIARIAVSRGRRFPAQVGDHKFWVFPVTPPDWLDKIEDERQFSVPGKQWIASFERDIDAACDQTMAEEEPRIVGREEAMEGIRCLYDYREVMDFLDKMYEADEVGFDVETKGLRPYEAGWRILSIAFSDGEDTAAFGIDHDECTWTPVQRRNILKKILRILKSKRVTTVAQNIPFDLEHLVELLDDESILTGRHGDYMQASFALDPGPPESSRVKDGEQEAPGHLSLDFMCSREFGLSLKALSPDIGALLRKGRAEEIGLAKMLPYNGLDAKWTLLGWREQMVKIKIQHLERAYKMQMDRVPCVVMAQRQGMILDQRVNAGFNAQLTKSLAETMSELSAMPDVQEYERRFGKFDPNKPAQVGKLLGDVCGFDEVRGEKKNSWKTDKVLLAEIGKHTKLVAPIIRFREDAKLKGTYIDRFTPGHPKSLIYPDGRIHYELGIAKARTGRLQSEKPNGQNWPKRKYKEIRGQLVPPPGHWFLSADQGQVEARMLACESRDEVWVQALWEDTDVHAVWAEKAAERHPPWYDKHARGDDGKKLTHKKAMKECRSVAKNGFVFPWFYGASDRAVGETQDWPEEVVSDLSGEFWSAEWFAGIKRWQRKKWKQYQRDHMVRSLTGRRRLAPLSWNQVINTPIQADASDVTVDAWVRLWRQSVRENKPHLAALLQVHDDLIFAVPEHLLDEAIEDVAKGQLGYRAPWLNIPLSVEVEIGRDWASMTPVGVFRSDEI